MQTLTIPPEQWTARLKKLSQSFEGWPVSLDVIPRADGQLREFRQIPLLGITAEPDGPIVISVGEATGAHVSHIIHAPTRVLLDKTNSGWNTALEIESADGEKAVLRFRSTEVDH
jgi:hypothetical protein